MALERPSIKPMEALYKKPVKKFAKVIFKRLVYFQTWFDATLVCRLMNVTEEVTIHRPNVSTLLSSAFIRGDLNAATRGPFI